MQARYFSLSAFCCGKKTKRQTSVSVDASFAVLLVVASLRWYCLTACAINGDVHVTIPS